MNGNEPWRKISNISKIVRNRKNGSLRMKKKRRKLFTYLKRIRFFHIFKNYKRHIFYIIYWHPLYFLIDLGKEIRRDTMLEYNKNFYNIMFGNIDEELQTVAESCI